MRWTEAPCLRGPPASPLRWGGEITGMDCKSHGGKRGRPPARTAATTRKRSESRNAEVYRRVRPQAGDDRPADACDRSGHKPDFPSSRIWIPHTGLPVGTCARVVVRRSHESVSSAGSGGNVRHDPVLTDEANNLSVRCITGRAWANRLLGHVRLNPCCSTE